MKKLLTGILALVLVLCFSGCGGSNSTEETNAKSILNSTQAILLPGEEQIYVAIKEIDLIKTQTAYNNEYSYYLVKTDSNEWGYAEFRNGTVIGFYVGFSRSVAKTRCKDIAEYRLSKLGSLGQ